MSEILLGFTSGLEIADSLSGELNGLGFETVRLQSGFDVIREAVKRKPAAVMLETGVEEAPLSSRLKLLLARLRLAEGRMDAAGGLVDDVLSVKPREEEALYLKGLIALERGDTTRAIDSWQKALRAVFRR